MAANRRHHEGPGTADDGEEATSPPAARRLRLPLRTLDDVKAEMARLYRSAKAGAVPVGDASKLANILAVLGRLIEVSPAAGRVPMTDAQGDTELPGGLDINDPLEVAKLLAEIGRRAAARAEEEERKAGGDGARERETRIGVVPIRPRLLNGRRDGLPAALATMTGPGAGL